MSGMRYWSDSAIRVKPSIELPSNHVPCRTEPSIWWSGIVTALTMPRMSVNWSWTNRTPLDLACSIFSIPSTASRAITTDAALRCVPAGGRGPCRCQGPHTGARTGAVHRGQPLADAGSIALPAPPRAGSAVRRGGCRRLDAHCPAPPDEVVQQPPELADEVHVSIEPAHQPQLACRRDAGPDPASRQVEGDEQAADE